MSADTKAYIEELGRMRAGMVNSMRENNAWDGFKRTLSDLYPDQAHFIYELLQNAEDAQATKAEFHLTHDKLVFVHDGKRLFEKKNAESITNIGHSTKRDDLNQIGKFGVGFKAVFAYTSTPRIYSGDFAFEIRDLFVPQWLDENPAAPHETRFEFPFNGPKSVNQCVIEISTWLRQMKDSVLLFLQNITSIRWAIGSGGWTETSRRDCAGDVVEIRHTSPDSVRRASSHWLRFMEPTELRSPLYIAVAFKLDMTASEGQQFLAGQPLQGRIVPTAGQLSIYFPAESVETKLHFHLHGPYASTVARDSIPVSHTGNQGLLHKTARLLTSAMTKVKAMGLLTTEFLEVLPNPTDELSPFYQPLLNELIQTFKTQPLVPVDRGGYAPAHNLMKGQARLREVIGKEELVFLTDTPAAQWVAGVMESHRADKFLDALDIQEWNWSELDAAMHAKFSGRGDAKAIAWLMAKDDEWLQGFYALLKQMLEDTGRRGVYHSGWRNDADRLQVQSWLIVRRSDEQLVAGATVFFPDKGVALPEFPLVKSTLVEGKRPRQVEAAKQFLVAAGVRSVEERDRIKLVLSRHYTFGGQPPSWQTHLEHLRSFIRWWSNNGQDTSLFRDSVIFFGGVGVARLKPTDAYIDSPLVDTGLSALFAANVSNFEKRHPLSAEYAKADIAQLKQFAESCGAMIRLTIQKTITQWNPHYPDLRSGGGKPNKNEKDDDYTIYKLDALLTANNVGVSALVWRTMCSASSDVLRARYCPNSTATDRYADSQLVCKLRESAWIPDRTGRFLKPSEIRREVLPDELAFDDRNGWLKAIGFESKRKQDSVAVQEKRKFAASLGISSEAFEMLEQLPEAARKQALDAFEKDLRRRKHHGEQSSGSSVDFADQFAKPFNRPGKPASAYSAPDNSPVSNPSQRRNRTDEEIEEARANEPTAADRTRLAARKVWESKNPEVRAALKEWYAGHCQICNATFRERDGENFFEAMYLVPRTQEGAAWIDRPGNVLCLCATCCAKFQHGSVESPENIVEKLRALKLARDGGTEPLAVRILLCAEEVTIHFTEKHLLDLQQMLAADSKQAASSASSAKSFPQPKL